MAAQVVAVIASLHQVQLGVTYADRIAALRAGRIVEDAPAARFDTRAIGQIYDRTISPDDPSRHGTLPAGTT